MSSFHNLLNGNLLLFTFSTSVPSQFYLTNKTSLLKKEKSLVCQHWSFLHFPSLLPVLCRGNKTCSPTFAASRQNSDLSSGIEPHNAAALPRRDHPHHTIAQRDEEQDEETMNVSTN